MKIAIAVQGRFFAFDLAPELRKRGHEVKVFTNYPKWAAARFGVAGECVRGFALHGVLVRLADRARTSRFFEAWLHRMFGRWAAQEIDREHWDVVYAWSGISEEIFRNLGNTGTLKLLMRGSSHIRTQAAILEEERKRAGVPLDQPSQWMIEREEREYVLADRVVVLSTFARRSFLEQGLEECRLGMVPLGADTRAFRPTPEVVEARRARILSGAPLRILYVGNISFQKGLTDLQAVIEKASRRFRFRLVGQIIPEVRQICDALTDRAEFCGHRPEQQLPNEYSWADLFLFPTLQDGYAVVLAQASAAALPILTTTNCAGPDVVTEGRTGWVLPIRRPDAFLGRLNWCDLHREELAEMVTVAYTKFRTRDWSDVATDFEQLCKVAPSAGQHSHA